MNLSSRISSLELDGSPKAVATLRYIQAILDGEVVIPGGIATLMTKLACDGYVNPEIDDEHFPGADPFVSIEGVVPVEIDMDVWTDPEATAFLAAMVPPMQPINPDKGIKWAAENHNIQQKKPLVILGQRCSGSGGLVCILVLREHDGGRNADLCGVRSRFSRDYLVLAEPKKKELAPGT